jgi:Ethanolamine utilization protein EutJ (predicted chaperonin)
VTATEAYTVGIDVGTAFTAAATCRGERTEAVTLGDHGDVIPSVAFLREDDVLLVGDAAERRAVSDATRVARGFKRRIGDDVPVSLGGRRHTAEALTAAIVRWVVDLVTTREGGAPSRTVLTLPASWRDHRRELLLGAAAEAGVDGAELLAEPVAAAGQYAARHAVPPGATVGIYDLGGGTFDAMIVRRSDEGFETVGQPQGDDRLGGIDFDTLVWDHVVGVVGADALDPDGDPSPHRLRALAQVRAAVVDAKEALSHDTQAVVPVTLPGLMTEVRITRAEFEEMARPALLRTVEVFGRTCEAAGLAPVDLHTVLLVGGSSRIPLIAQLIGHELGARVTSDAHPKLTTCLGAARATTTEGWAPLAPPQPEPESADADAGAEPDDAQPDTDAEPDDERTSVAATTAAATPPDGDDTDATGAVTPPDGQDDAGHVPPAAARAGSRRRARRVLGVAALVAFVAAAVFGATRLRSDPDASAAPDERRDVTTTTDPTTSTTPTTADATITTTAETTAATAEAPTQDTVESAQTTGTTASRAPAPAPTPGPGSPCNPADGNPDCTDASADGSFRIVSGYADCIAAAGAASGICTDLDGDGQAGYPDSG